MRAGGTWWRDAGESSPPGAALGIRLHCLSGSPKEVLGESVQTFGNVNESVNFLLIVFIIFICIYTDLKIKHL